MIYAGTFTNDGAAGGATFTENGELLAYDSGVLDNVNGGAIDVSTSGAVVDANAVYNDVHSSSGHAASTITISGEFDNEGTFVNDGTTTAAATLESISCVPSGNFVNNGSFGVRLYGNQALTYGGNLSGTGTFWVWGSGVLTLSGDNTITGGTYIYSGTTLQLGSAMALDDPAGAVTMYGGTLDLNGYNLTIGSLTTWSGYGSVVTDNAAASGTSTLTLTNGTSRIYTCTICDGPYRNVALAIGSTTVSGTVVLYLLDSTVTNTGGTTINANGTLYSDNFTNFGTLTDDGDWSLEGTAVNYAGAEIADYSTLTIDGGADLDQLRHAERQRRRHAHGRRVGHAHEQRHLDGQRQRRADEQRHADRRRGVDDQRQRRAHEQRHVIRHRGGRVGQRRHAQSRRYVPVDEQRRNLPQQQDARERRHLQSNGTITVDASSWVWNDTAITIDNGSTLEIDGYLYNYGTVTVQNSSTLYSNWGYISSAGTIYVSSGSTLNSVGELGSTIRPSTCCASTMRRSTTRTSWWSARWTSSTAARSTIT